MKILTIVTIGTIVTATPAMAASEAVRCVQSELNELGYTAGQADGLFGNTTFQAAEDYRERMLANSPGWSQPPLTEQNAALWCEQVAEAFPQISQHFDAFKAVPVVAAATLSVTTMAVEENLKAGVPYTVRLGYEIAGGQAKVKEGCFTWSGEGPYCFPVRVDEANKQAVIQLQTGNPNQYDLGGFLRYSSNGGDHESNAMTTSIDVRP